MNEKKSNNAKKHLARRLRRKLKVPLDLEITDNSYTMVSFSQRHGAYRVRLHRMFLAASDTVVATLVGYINDTDRQASIRLDDYIHLHRQMIRRIPPRIRWQQLPLRSCGRVYDLNEILREVCAEFFDFNSGEVAIAWAPAPRVRLPRHSIKLGSYGADTQIIRIHPALDQPAVPRLFVRWIVYHELLHHVFRRELKKRRGRIHTQKFTRRERLFPEYQKAMFWERRNLDILLRWKPPRHG